jgi:beta-glucosidase
VRAQAQDAKPKYHNHDPVASVTRPVKELRGYKRIDLRPGEKKSVTFSLSPEELGFPD